MTFRQWIIGAVLLLALLAPIAAGSYWWVHTAGVRCWKHCPSMTDLLER